VTTVLRRLLTVKKNKKRNSEGGLGKSAVKIPDKNNGKTVRTHDAFESRSKRAATARLQDLKRSVSVRLQFMPEE
jgi:hypothetical protein